MNKGHLTIEASLILPLIILIIIFSVSAILFFVIRTNNDLDMHMRFFGNEEDEEIFRYTLKMPLIPEFEVEFIEHKKDVDYGRHIQKSRILSDIFRD